MIPGLKEKQKGIDLFNKEMGIDFGSPPSKYSTPLSKFHKDYIKDSNPSSKLSRNVYEARCELFCLNSGKGYKTSQIDNIITYVGREGYKDREMYCSYLKLDEKGNLKNHYLMKFDEESEEEIQDCIYDADLKKFWVLSGKKLHLIDEKKQKKDYSIQNVGSSLLKMKNNLFLSTVKKEIDIFNVESEKFVGNLKLNEYNIHSLCPTAIQSNSFYGVDEESPYFVKYDTKKQSISGYFLGASTPAEDIKVNSECPNWVGTSHYLCSKIWDDRIFKPIYTFPINSGTPSFDFASINGIPYFFMGGTNESVLVYDIRSQKALYELSSGNNHIISINWHNQSQSLVFTCENDYIGIYGTRFYGDDDEPDNDSNWPQKAVHERNHFNLEFNNEYKQTLIYKFMNQPKNFMN